MSLGGGILTNAKAKEAAIAITVIRANGRVEELGTVCYWHRNPLKRWMWEIKNFFRGIKW